MTLYKVYGSELVDNRTQMELFASGEIADLDLKAKAVPPVQFSFGATDERTPFVEIGINKPLTIEIRHIYTGQYPKGIFGSNNDMLVSSAMKSISTFNAAPRAINYLRNNITQNFNLASPSATQEGTPLIFYSPALTEKNTVLTVEIIFNRFPKELVDSIGNAFMVAAGIPIFADKSVPLLAAGVVIKLSSRLAEKLVDSSPSFSVTEPLSFLRPGDDKPEEGFHLMVEDSFDLAREDCEFNPETGRLVYRSNGKPYDGDYPYIVFSLDGSPNKDYEQFSPTAASAALLKSFYHISEGQQQPVETLLEAVKLYNDWQFRTRADKTWAELETFKEGTEPYEKKKTEYNAYVANIFNIAMKPEN